MARHFGAADSIGSFPLAGAAAGPRRPVGASRFGRPSRYNGAVGGSIRFYWRAARGHRLWPWRSPYLRWRIETYTGKPAEQVGLGTMLGFALGRPGRIFRFARWCNEMARWRRLSRRPALSAFAGPEQE